MRKLDFVPVPPLQPPDSMHLEAAQGWLELGNHEEANEELELIDAPLRSHPDVLEVRWDIYAKVKNWEACLDIGKAMVKLDPRRFTGWINRSFALHELKRTQEACDQLHEGLYRFPMKASSGTSSPATPACWATRQGRARCWIRPLNWAGTRSSCGRGTTLTCRGCG